MMGRALLLRIQRAIVLGGHRIIGREGTQAIAQAIGSMLVRVHDGVADLPPKIRGRLSNASNEINQIARASELMTGSPVWTRFELLRPKWQCDRTHRRVLLSD